MKKRSIWNKYGKKTAEYVNEWGKWYRFDTYADFGIDHGDRFGGLLIGYVGLITVPMAYN